MAMIRILLVTITLVLPGVILHDLNGGRAKENKEAPLSGFGAGLEENPVPSCFNGGYFTENLGQWDGIISYSARTPFGRIGLGPGSVHFALFNGDTGQDNSGLIDPSMTEDDTGSVKGHVLRYDFNGGENCMPAGVGPLPHLTNYFIGNDPDRWVSGARSYREVVYQNVWEGIDIVYHFGKEGFKYDLLIAPGASVEDIRIGIEGHDSLFLDNGRSLTVQTGYCALMDEKLDVFYRDDPSEKIDSRFVIHSDRTFGFELSEYRSDRCIVIDPVVTSTYLGGSDSDKGLTVDIDREGNVIMGGCTSSVNFPTKVGSYDTTHGGDNDYFISKFNGDLSSLIFSTYIGGSGDDGYYDNFIDVVDDGILMAGTTRSSDFPTTAGCYDDSLAGYYDTVFLKLKSDGSDLIFSSYLGGTGSQDTARGILESWDGGFFVYGYTGSSDFPTTEGAYMAMMSGYGDGYISKFKSSGDELLNSTFMGGSSSTDQIYHLVEASDHDIFIAGNTYSDDFPVSTGAYSQTMSGYSDAFIARMEGDLSDVICATYIGGGSSDRLYTMALDDRDNAVVVGDTYSDDFPLTEGVLRTTFSGYSEGYICMFKYDLTDLVVSTYIGGDSLDTANCVAFDPFGDLIVAGYTSSSDIDLTPDAQFKSNSGDRDGFISVMHPDMKELEYATYYGGSMNDSIMGEIAVDPYGKAFMTGYTDSTDLPLFDPYQGTLGGSRDSFLLSIDITPWLEPEDVEEVGLYSDPDYLNGGNRFDIGQKVYVELKGTDANTSIRSGARVNITYPDGSLPDKRLILLETDNSSGVYHGSFFIPATASYFQSIDIVSWKDPTKKARLVVDYPYRPRTVTSLTIFSDPGYSTQKGKFDLGDQVYVEVRGEDSNIATRDYAFVNSTSDKNESHNMFTLLRETGESTGIYRGSYVVPPFFLYLENITVYSVGNEGVSDTFMVHTPVQIRPLEDELTAVEDEEYSVTYWNFGYNPGTWTVHYSAEWLSWGEDNMTLYGMPRNNHVYTTDVSIRIEDGAGNSDVHNFELAVDNTPPGITNENRLYATEGQEYYTDYNSTDDGQGEITWSVAPDGSWFSIDENSGVLAGIPGSDDVRSGNVTVMVNDGNGGIGSTTFMLTVLPWHRPPVITTADIRTGKQGEKYYNQYRATDPNGDTDLTWELYTDAPFLAMDNYTGELSGTPGTLDVGTWSVNVTAIDPTGLTGSREFILTIENVNDRPLWVDVPGDAEVVHGSIFIFDVNASDPDVGDELEYTLWTDTEADMEINKRTGVIRWRADYPLLKGKNGELEVNLRVADAAAMFQTHTFTLTVVPTRPPTVSLIGPEDGARTTSRAADLEWSGSDPEGEHLTYWIYISENRPFVETRKADALHLGEYNGTSLTFDGPVQGWIYYWTVRPFDQCTFGTCVDGIRSFRVNNVPQLGGVPDQKVSAGETFRYKVTGTDEDPEDSSNLAYSIVEGPEGVQISGTTGEITWRTSGDDKGTHRLVISVTDGLEQVQTGFDIEVKEAEEGGLDPMVLGMVGLGFLFVVIIILQILILTRKRPGKGEGEIDRKKATKEIRDIIKETADDLEKTEIEPEEADTTGEPEDVQTGVVREQQDDTEELRASDGGGSNEVPTETLQKQEKNPQMGE